MTNKLLWSIGISLLCSLTLLCMRQKNKGAPHGEARPYSYEKSVITGSD